MNGNTPADLKMTIYHNQHPIISCKPDYLGFMGLFMKGIQLGYPVGTPLEVEFTNYEQNIKGQRVPMLVSNSEKNGTGLRLKNFEKEVINQWQKVLQNMRHKLQVKTRT